MPQPVSGQAPDAQGKATFAHISILLTWIATLIMWSIYKDNLELFTAGVLLHRSE